MANGHNVYARVADFLANRETLEALEDWSASYLHDVYRLGDEDDRRAIHLVRSILNAFEDDQSENGLRRELAEALRPFDPNSAVPSRNRLIYGQSSILTDADSPLGVGLSAGIYVGSHPWQSGIYGRGHDVVLMYVRDGSPVECRAVPNLVMDDPPSFPFMSVPGNSTDVPAGHPLYLQS